MVVFLFLTFFLLSRRVNTWRFLLFSESPTMQFTVIFMQHIVGVQWENALEYLSYSWEQKLLFLFFF